VDYVKGLKNFSYKFHRYFSVDTESERININFAPIEVIRAYLPEIAQCADKIVEDREEKPFTNITQLRDVAGITDEDYLAVQPFITTKSEMFAVRIEVIFEDNIYYATALLKRSDKDVQIIKYFEGKGFYE
jgi:type II secretory pathway component PulK